MRPRGRGLQGQITVTPTGNDRQWYTGVTGNNPQLKYQAQNTQGGPDETVLEPSVWESTNTGCDLIQQNDSISGLVQDISRSFDPGGILQNTTAAAETSCFCKMQFAI